MYDAREKAIRDQQWALNASFRDGEAKGKTEGETKVKVMIGVNLWTSVIDV